MRAIGRMDRRKDAWEGKGDETDAWIERTERTMRQMQAERWMVKGRESRAVMGREGWNGWPAELRLQMDFVIMKVMWNEGWMMEDGWKRWKQALQGTRT